jgi:hypothetical protein
MPLRFTLVYGICLGFNSVGCCLVRSLLQVKGGWLLLLADSVCMDWQFCIYWLANGEQLEFISVGFWQYRNKASFNTCTASRGSEVCGLAGRAFGLLAHALARDLDLNFDPKRVYSSPRRRI